MISNESRVTKLRDCRTKPFNPATENLIDVVAKVYQEVLAGYQPLSEADVDVYLPLATYDNVASKYLCRPEADRHGNYFGLSGRGLFIRVRPGPLGLAYGYMLISVAMAVPRAKEDERELYPKDWSPDGEWLARAQQAREEIAQVFRGLRESQEASEAAQAPTGLTAAEREILRGLERAVQLFVDLPSTPASGYDFDDADVFHAAIDQAKRMVLLRVAHRIYREEQQDAREEC